MILICTSPLSFKNHWTERSSKDMYYFLDGGIRTGMTLGRKWQVVLRNKGTISYIYRNQVSGVNKWSILGQIDLRKHWALWLAREHLFFFTWKSHFSAPTNFNMQENKPNTAVSSSFSSDINLDLCVKLAINSKQFKALCSSRLLRQNQTCVSYIRPLGCWPLTELIIFQALCRVLEYIEPKGNW